MAKKTARKRTTGGAAKKSVAAKRAAKAPARKRTAGNPAPKKAPPAKRIARKGAKKSPAKSAKKTAPKKSGARWSGRVTKTSDAMDLAPHIFESTDPKKIAQSLKRSAEKSHRRKGTPFRSAMSMITFYLNRAGRNLSAAEKKPIEQAKEELRKLYGRE